jgi:hypothetical protein
LSIQCFTDRNPRRQGARVGTIPVRSLAEGVALGLPVVIGTLNFASEVEQEVLAAAREQGLPEPAVYRPAPPDLRASIS